jgi:hypothetical protein
MDVDVPAQPEVPVEQTRKTSSLTDIEKFRIIELRKASLLALAFCCPQFVVEN